MDISNRTMRESLAWRATIVQDRLMLTIWGNLLILIGTMAALRLRAGRR